MRLRPLLVAFCLLLGMSGTLAAPAFSQDGTGSGLSDLEKALGEATGGSPTTTSPDAQTDTDDAQPPTIPDPASVTPPAGTTPAPAAGTVVPVPPPYLTPGQSAGIQPISAVASLTEPDVPLEPVRIAALVALALTALLIGVATLLRTLGLRTAITSPVVVEPPNRFTRARERTARLSDDVRDFLRHSR